MSEAAAEAPASGGGNALTRKIGPLPAWVWLAIIGAGGALAWYVWKQRQASSAASQATTLGNCTDTSGNSVPCDQVDYGGEIATLQAEIQDLQGQKSPAPSPGGGGPKVAWPAPSGLHSTTYRTSASLAWGSPAGNSAQYHVQVWTGSTSLYDQGVTGGHAQVGGLKPGTAYNWRVAVAEDNTHLASPFAASSFRTKP